MLSLTPVQFKHTAEFLAIHYDVYELARAALRAVETKARDEEALERLVSLVAGPRSCLSMALAYLDVAVEAGTLAEQFPEIQELFDAERR